MNGNKYFDIVDAYWNNATANVCCSQVSKYFFEFFSLFLMRQYIMDNKIPKNRSETHKTKIYEKKFLCFWQHQQRNYISLFILCSFSGV